MGEEFAPSSFVNINITMPQHPFDLSNNHYSNHHKHPTHYPQRFQSGRSWIQCLPNSPIAPGSPSACLNLRRVRLSIDALIARHVSVLDVGIEKISSVFKTAIAKTLPPCTPSQTPYHNLRTHHSHSLKEAQNSR